MQNILDQPVGRRDLLRARQSRRPCASTAAPASPAIAGLLADMAVQGQAPALGNQNRHLDTVFFHCAKALKRSRLWDGEAQIDRKPTSRAMGRSSRISAIPEGTADEIEDHIQTIYQE